MRQVFEQRPNADHPCYRCPLIGLSQSFVVNESVPHLHDAHISVFEPPKLARLQLLTGDFTLHITETDTGDGILLRQNALQFCNVFIALCGWI